MNSRQTIKDRALKARGPHSFFDFSAVFGKPAALYILPHIYPTSISPIHITILATAAGTGAAALIAAGSRQDLIAAAFLVQIKNILDTLDGHLARARNRPSRIGGLLDSDTDFLTNLLLFLAVRYRLAGHFPTTILIPMVSFAFFSSLIQCSYFVYYVRCYLAVAEGIFPAVVGEITTEDLPPAGTASGKKVQKFLELFYHVVYGWQDLLIRWIDRLSLKLSTAPKRIEGRDSEGRLHAWYSRKDLLEYHSVMGLGTQLFILSVTTALDRLDLYLLIPPILGNLYLGANIFLRIRRARLDFPA